MGSVPSQLCLLSIHRSFNHYNKKTAFKLKSKFNLIDYILKRKRKDIEKKMYDNFSYIGY